MSTVLRHSVGGDSLGDILERVLDKGVVVAGDVSVSIAGIELLTVRIRLLVASVDKAKEIGLTWWEGDPYFSGDAAALQARNAELQGEIETLTRRLAALEAAAGRPDGDAV